MSRKSAAQNFFNTKIKTTPKNEFRTWLENMPISKLDFDFILDLEAGLTYKELSVKYSKSEARVYQWKRTLAERLTRIDRFKY